MDALGPAWCAPPGNPGSGRSDDPRAAQEGDREAASPPGSPGDRELIQDILRGDERGALPLYRTLRPSIDAGLLRVLGMRTQEHEDLVQEALEAVVNSVRRKRFAGRCALTTWASAIATRIALGELRRMRKVRNSLQALESDQHSYDGAATIVANAELNNLRAALSSIPTRRAEVVVLHDIHGYALKEVAALLGVSATAAHSRLVRGRRQLRQRLRLEDEE